MSWISWLSSYSRNGNKKGGSNLFPKYGDSIHWNVGIFFTTSSFCSLLCDEVCYGYWYYLKCFYTDDVNDLISFSIYSNKIVHELLQKPRTNFLPQVEILFRNDIFKMGSMCASNFLRMALALFWFLIMLMKVRSLCYCKLRRNRIFKYICLKY